MSLTSSGVRVLERYRRVLQVDASTMYSIQRTINPAQSLVCGEATQKQFRITTESKLTVKMDALTCLTRRTFPGLDGSDTGSPAGMCTTWHRPSPWSKSPTLLYSLTWNLLTGDWRVSDFESVALTHENPNPTRTINLNCFRVMVYTVSLLQIFIFYIFRAILHVSEGRVE
jgi:hypothetical protein